VLLTYTLKLKQKGQNIMNSTNDDKEKLKWGKWGDDSEKTPAFKEYIELLLKFNNQQKEILQETKEWLLNTSGNKKH
jgi:hypothetical protein